LIDIKYVYGYVSDSCGDGLSTDLLRLTLFASSSKYSVILLVTGKRLVERFWCFANIVRSRIRHFSMSRSVIPHGTLGIDADK